MTENENLFGLISDDGIKRYFEESADGEISAPDKRDQYLSFLLDGELFGIAMEQIAEIITIQSITYIPEMPNFIKGVTNLRGQIIPVMDLRLRLDKPEREPDDRTCIVIVQFEGIQVGLIIDRVQEALSIPQSTLEPAQKMENHKRTDHITGIAHLSNQVVICLDIEKVLYEENMLAIKNSQLHRDEAD